MLAVSLVGCGGVKTIKQESGDSDSKQLMKILGVKNHTEYLIDGTSPETASIGVPDSILQKYNSSMGRHAVNYMVGGIGGLLSLGIMQNDDFTQYKDQFALLNNVQVISIVESGDFSYVSFFKELTSSYNESYPELNINKNVSFPENKKESIYIQGEECSLEAKNCRLHIQGHYANTNYSYETIPDSFKEGLDNKKTYSLGRFRFYEISGSNYLDNFENLKIMFSKLKKHDDKALLLYIPSALNNGVPVIINQEGKEHYFVKK